uniref:DNA/RNA-binding protein Alba-like domain-containing protein n=1 Tax=Euplotes harpa TaxID=151035 RepID=A0A7S3NCP9_9SPIT|mmetsp:Transcript_8473/g.9608  ORF Transcript_8473/g.9608 Transcript_8473/m.9608 type:complete len:137 (+) Transcript_8473:24-434(+)
METKGTKEGSGADKKGEIREEQTVGPRIVNVSANRNFSFFVYQAKKFFKVAEEKPIVEMHAIGSAISIAVQAAEALVKYNYATYASIRTDKVEVEREYGTKLSRAKLFITLNKSKDFDKAWEEFEKKRDEQHLEKE